MHIRPFQPEDRDAVLDLAIRAWAPVFASFESVLGPEIYRRIYPDWMPMQRAAVDEILHGAGMEPWVSTADGVVSGFIVWERRDDRRSAEVHMLAVDPEWQNQGIGTALNTFALDHLQAAGIELVEVGTGGDPGHAPARRSYEKAGYTPLPIVRYYKAFPPDGEQG